MNRIEYFNEFTNEGITSKKPEQLTDHQKNIKVYEFVREKKEATLLEIRTQFSEFSDEDIAKIFIVLKEKLETIQVEEDSDIFSSKIKYRPPLKFAQEDQLYQLICNRSNGYGKTEIVKSNPQKAEEFLEDLRKEKKILIFNPNTIEIPLSGRKRDRVEQDPIVFRNDPTLDLKSDAKQLEKLAEFWNNIEINPITIDTDVANFGRQLPKFRPNLDPKSSNGTKLKRRRKKM